MDGCTKHQAMVCREADVSFSLKGSREVAANSFSGRGALFRAFFPTAGKGFQNGEEYVSSYMPGRWACRVTLVTPSVLTWRIEHPSTPHAGKWQGGRTKNLQFQSWFHLPFYGEDSLQKKGSRTLQPSLERQGGTNKGLFCIFNQLSDWSIPMVRGPTSQLPWFPLQPTYLTLATNQRTSKLSIQGFAPLATRPAKFDRKRQEVRQVRQAEAAAGATRRRRVRRV